MFRVWENKFEDEFEKFFDIARLDAIDNVKMEEDRQFLINIDVKTLQE